MRIENATLADGRVVDVRVEDGAIDAVGDLDPVDGEEVLDADENLLLPGAIDVHVHFREPGFEHKETWETGSRSAAAGGVTTVADQPNTDPTTTTGDGFDAKADRAANSCIDYGINGGVTPDWDPENLFERPLFALGEVFLADSTGDMGIDADLFAAAAERAGEAGVPVTVHAEDAELFDESAIEGDLGGPGRDADSNAWSAYRRAEAEEAAVERAVRVGGETGAQIHIAHTSTPEGVDAARDGGATCEVTPHHLFLSRDDCDELGTYGRMNPPLRSEARREAMFERLADGRIDVVATDHAPHTREEKDQSLLDAPSGVPGVETMVPLLLGAAVDGDLSLERVRDVVATNPADIFDLPQKGRIEAGADADLVLYDLDDAREIRGDDLHSKCGWTPFEGFTGVFPEWTMLRGELVWDGDEFGDASGENVRV
ncbi:dihydroorotase [Haloferax mediterranei ATCC 33500]|uniref:Dihydroorotase n=1 Tax=Haloferax mediterranei (strain ATCC 33500 / DSM 1411 / JCM 8866 / NBRC 14739 / NCIMB 2177 / R-4) TaxID=523841 RepID=I3R5S7_HALMT|nr:dihydroorotase [Haloferax mediterranei]AFK19587.1 dihydroorotase [Haloferax mediterranei ATCC 33500]AHZ22979.1 dihydroorotase [Haloferax mediterranei ATCC 33500]ELZ99907.1 dihydroorotase [Haloferax mediterranei ATCC 33500]MDX5987672.1 dihydroorotase [Haloferax mediterranei ATCC 33500]QCQ74156.1 dihydroorotase [Haloferax mediterranei ATCC 33500]